ncbi:hypothetical protein GCM10023335_77100 [Streptomyces siamensis]|uniref:Transposase n=1 Tax=Streptomyces siamensis TaxID=1274986 RepID=A0ABP9JJW6_9ACTN
MRSWHRTYPHKHERFKKTNRASLVSCTCRPRGRDAAVAAQGLRIAPGTPPGHLLTPEAPAYRSDRLVPRAQRVARCYERLVTVIDAFFDLADTITTVRSLIRRSWTTHRWDERPNRRP